MVSSRNSKKNLGTLFIVIVIIVGFITFFTSNLWMPASGNAEKFSPLNKAYIFCERKVTPIRWQYAPSQKMMEVELDIVNEAFDGIDSYSYSAATSEGADLAIKRIVESEDFVVLEISDLPSKWAEVSLHMTLPEDTEQNDGTVLKLYTNINEVEQVQQLEEKSKKDYLIQRMDLTILYYENQIQQLQKDIEDQKNSQELIKEGILQMERQKAFQTDSEKLATDTLIAGAGLKLTTSEAVVEKDLQDIREYEEKIENAKSKKTLYEAMSDQE